MTPRRPSSSLPLSSKSPPASTGPSTMSTSLSKTRVLSAPTTRIQDEHLFHTSAWHPQGSRIGDSSACQASDPGPRRPPYLPPAHTLPATVLRFNCGRRKGGSAVGQPGWDAEPPSPSSAHPRVNGRPPLGSVRCVWPLAPQGSVPAGESRMEGRRNAEATRGSVEMGLG